MSKQVINTGYESLYLTDRLGNTKFYLVHRLLGAAFVANPENLPEINHLDRVVTHNCVDNIEWCTHAENMAHLHQASIDPIEYGYVWLQKDDDIRKVDIKDARKYKDLGYKYSSSKGFTEYTLSDEIKNKISASQKLGMTEERRQKISEAKKGKPGHVITEEIKQKISQANTGKRRTEEQKKHFSEVHKGIANTEEQKAKIKATMLAKKLKWITNGKDNQRMPEADAIQYIKDNPEWRIGRTNATGRKVSEETRQKMREANTNNQALTEMRWITNGTDNLRLKPDEAARYIVMHPGWKFGRNFNRYE